jgi:hypothetical protein
MAACTGQNIINHVALVLDASGSMARHMDQLIKVADAQIAELARDSQRLNQETRVSIYSFDNRIQCLVWDMDVLRLPSIKDVYKIGGATALIEATLKSLDDLSHTWEQYGDHSFLIFVITDGQENASGGSFHNNRPELLGPWIDKLSSRITALPEHWTVAALVPDALTKRQAVRTYGFPASNVTVWDTESVTGVEEAIKTISTATTTYMSNRASGVRGTRSVFATGGQIDAQSVQAAHLTPLDPSEYVLIPVVPDEEAYKERVAKGMKTADARPEIQPFVAGCNHHYRVGKAYYQLAKREKIQGNKAIIVVEKKTAKAYAGDFDAARKLLGLPEHEISVKPEPNSEYLIYIQSTSNNRKLDIGTKLLLLLK